MRLPLDCTVDYFSDFLKPDEADNLYQTLISDYHIDQARLTILAGGQMIETDSFKILFATERLIQGNSHPEEIHGKSFPWTGIMADLRQRVEQLTEREFELAMCLYYPDGNFFAAYHSDQETSGAETVLPSLSLGEVREFCFRNKASGETYSLDLAHGSLLVMGNHCQSRYEHALPKNPGYQNGRINITFREPNFM